MLSIHFLVPPLMYSCSVFSALSPHVHIEIFMAPLLSLSLLQLGSVLCTSNQRTVPSHVQTSVLEAWRGLNFQQLSRQFIRSTRIVVSSSFADLLTYVGTTFYSLYHGQMPRKGRGASDSGSSPRSRPRSSSRPWPQKLQGSPRTERQQQCWLF